MIIRSQDGEKLFVTGDGNKITMGRYYNDGKRLIYENCLPPERDVNCFTIECDEMIVGEYSTKENALSVMERMCVNLTNFDGLHNIFQMPYDWEDDDEI